MAGFPELIKERIGIGNAIYPFNSTAVFTTSGTVSQANFARTLFHVLVGIVGGGSVQCGLQTGNNANGSDGANFAGSTIGTNIAISNQQATFEFAYGATEAAGTVYTRGFINVATGPANVAGVIWGTDPRFSPGSSFNNNSVNTQVAA